MANTCAKLGITESGKRWLDLCLDPFKDLNMPTAGYPDAVTIPSVVQTIHDSYSVSVPVGVPVGGRWDCNIFLDQLYNSVPLYSTNYNETQGFVNRLGQGATGFSRGGLVMRSATAGTNLDITTTTFGASLKQDILNEGDVRVVGIGLEIHNTTEDLHKAGALITYRVPDAPLTQELINHYQDGGNVACLPLSTMAVPLVEVPYTASAAIDLPGSLQWEAKDGAYIVPVLSAPTLFPESLEPLPPITRDGVAYYYPALSSSGASNLIAFTTDVRNLLHGFSTSGVYLTGLSYETSLQVNLTYYVEVFPKKDSVLRRSVQPATGLDAKALDLYAHIISHLPTGVEVNDNFLGAFIAGIARVASTVGGFLFRNADTIKSGLNIAGQAANLISNNIPTRISLPSRREEEVEEVNSPAIRRELDRRAGPIISDVIKPSGREIVVQANRSGVTRTDYVPRGSIRQNNGTQMVRTQKAREKKNRIIDQATKGYAGNRWIDNPKKR